MSTFVVKIQSGAWLQSPRELVQDYIIITVIRVYRNGMGRTGYSSANGFRAELEDASITGWHSISVEAKLLSTLWTGWWWCWRIS